MEKLTKTEILILTTLTEKIDVDGFSYFCFEPLQSKLNLNRTQVTRACRSLKRKGFAKYGKGLWTDDGPYGAGYAATAEGARILFILGLTPSSKIKQGGSVGASSLDGGNNESEGGT